MNENLKHLIKQLNKITTDDLLISDKEVDQTLNKLKEALTDYEEKIETHMTHSRSHHAREIAKTQMLYFQSIDIILSDSQEKEETSLLYSEFALDFVKSILYHTGHHLIQAQENEKENNNAEIRR